MKRKLTSLILALAILAWPLSTHAQTARLNVPVYVDVAEPDVGTLRYSLISSILATCYIENGKVIMGGTVVAQGLKNSCTVVLKLQKNDGSGWKSNGTWSTTGTGEATKYASKTAVGGVFYRLKVTGKVTADGTTESDAVTTLPCVL